MKKILIMVACAISIHMHSQFQLQSINLGETTNNMQAISIGEVTSNGDIQSRLHVNNFFCDDPGGGLNGFLFRTDGDDGVDNIWHLWTGTSSTSQTERFRIRTLSGGFDTYLERTQAGSEADIRLLTAEVQIRARNTRLGAFCSINGGADEVVMGDGTDVNFTALSSTHRRLFFHGSNGFLGLGSEFQETGGILPNYHFHMNDSNDVAIYQQFTNGISGNTNTDGLRLGLNLATSYEIRSYDPDIWFDIAQNNSGRMRFRDIDTWTGLNGLTHTNCNRIMVPLRNQDLNHPPICMMQLGTVSDGNIGRNWMNVGTAYGTNQDAMYVGWMERANPTGGNLQSDAVIAWGCQRGLNNNSTASDNFRIIFLASPTDMNADSAGTVQGKEVFRIEPFSGNVGIGNYSQNSINPPGNPNYVGAKLDIDGDLRIRDVIQDDTLDQILVRDPNDLGRLFWRDVSTIAGDCEWNMVTNGTSNDLVMGYGTACNTGNVGIGLAFPTSKLTVRNILNNTGMNTTVDVTSAVSNGQNVNRGMYVRAGGGVTEIVGVRSEVTAINNGAAGPSPLIGVAGIATSFNFCNWRTIGVYGRGSGIPTCGGSVDAGYFAGNVTVNGTYLYGSDENLKTDIEGITGATDKLLQLVPSSYTFKTEEYPTLGLDDGEHFGFIAQELEQVLPQLVKQTSSPELKDEDDNYISEHHEYKAIAYLELIPILVSGFQEQQALIESLQAELTECCSMEERRSNVDDNHQDVRLSNASIVLNQNVPNPFAERTTISYSITEDFSKAQILFYDANGKLIQATDIITKGAGQLNVFADDLTNGVYSYALVVDGKIIDTKKMVKQ